jgi:hypothetical protein
MFGLEKDTSNRREFVSTSRAPLYGSEFEPTSREAV